MKENEQLIPHLFRTEYRKIVAVLCRRFGLEQVEAAEDIASDTFFTAIHSWGVGTIPGNPTAWLYNVARNKAINFLHRSGIYASRVIPAVKEANDPVADAEIDFSSGSLLDSQLQMMFAICHPALPVESQIALSLRILCGLGTDEIATAFLTNKETIAKRIYRAKEKLREEKISLAFPGNSVIAERLEQVLTTIYLLFNEGYYSISREHSLSRDLCYEAMFLCQLLLEHESTRKPQVYALLSLMCFHASRFDARQKDDGGIILYGEQDRSRWNADLIGKGAFFLKAASTGERLSKFHLEAGIAWWNTVPDSEEKWSHILELYDLLAQLDSSPVVALNRAYALYKVKGPHIALKEAEKLDLGGSQLYAALLGELYSTVDRQKALQHFQKAASLAHSEADRQAMLQKIGILSH